MTILDERRPAAGKDAPDDLGFGAVVARESRKRLLNRDGTFNVRREGLPFWQSLSLYHYLLTISWPRFLALVAAAFVATNALFAAVYVACGAHALTAFENDPVPFRFLKAFFFSVHTLATIGYGSIAPANVAANVVVSVEAFVGLLAFALVAGIVFARFSRPVAQLVFSRNAIVAPYRDGTALMFRLVNQRRNEMVELRAQVLLSRRKREGKHAADREFLRLDLERETVVFFPLTWTVVHPIDRKSPMWGLSHEDLVASDAEVLILINGFDETFSQTLHTRTSYKPDEIVWGAKFTTVFNPPQADGTVSVDIRKLHEFERVEMGSHLIF